MQDQVTPEFLNAVNWGVASSIATTFGFALGALSAWMAAVTFRAQVEANADTHMHGLFRELLMVGIDGKGAGTYRLQTFQLYVLEEIVDWIGEQRRELRWWGWLRPFTAAARRKELDDWSQTAAGHLRRGMRERVLDRPGYGKAFQDFVAKHAAPMADASWQGKINPASDDSVES